MSKIYLYNEQGHDEPLEITEEEIIKRYWPYWSDQMIKKFGEEDTRITEERCIDEWTVVNWAWEKKDDTQV